MRVKCLAQEHNKDNVPSQTARYRKEKEKSNNRLFTQTAYNSLLRCLYRVLRARAPMMRALVVCARAS